MLGGFYVTIRRKLSDALPDADAEALVEQMRRSPVVVMDRDLVSAAIANARAWRPSYWEALIVAVVDRRAICYITHLIGNSTRRAQGPGGQDRERAA